MHIATDSGVPRILWRRTSLQKETKKVGGEGGACSVIGAYFKSLEKSKGALALW